MSQAHSAASSTAYGVRDALRADLAAGSYPVGCRLLATYELAKMLSRGIVCIALHLLASEARIDLKGKENLAGLAAIDNGAEIAPKLELVA